jgi:hypothetical protein
MQIGEIPTVRIGKLRLAKPEELIKYIESNTYSLNQYFKHVKWNHSPLMVNCYREGSHWQYDITIEACITSC